MKNFWSTGRPSSPQTSLIVGILAAVGASVCCVGPLLLVIVGIGGRWVGQLTAMEPYRPYLVALTVTSMGAAFHSLYLAPRKCGHGDRCANPRVLSRQRRVFWIVAVALVVLLAIPMFAPLFY